MKNIKHPIYHHTTRVIYIHKKRREVYMKGNYSVFYSSEAKVGLKRN